MRPVRVPARITRPLLVFVVFVAVSDILSAQAQDQPYLGGPPPGQVPLEVQVGFSLINLTDVNEQDETISFDAAFTLAWKDPRLAYDPAEVGAEGFVPGDYDRIPRRIYQGASAVQGEYPGWRPDFVLMNGIGDRATSNVAIGVWPDGMVAYLEMFHSTVETPMNLRRFPFDRQKLDVFVQPFAYGRSEVAFVPSERMSHTWDQNLGIAEWERRGVTVQERSIDIARLDGSQREVSEVVVSVDIKRRPDSVLLNIVLPLVLLVGLTWVVFWMGDESLPNRLSISFIGILSVVAYNFVILDTVPEISYLTLVDAFILLSYLALVASVVVNVIVDRRRRNGRNEKAERLDRVCRWVFPGAYAAFAGLLVFVFFGLL